MNNFEYKNPVKIYFGKGQIKNLTEIIAPNSKVLLTYGQGSIKCNGIYEQVCLALKSSEVIEFGGIEPNPEYLTLCKAIMLAKKEKIDFILAVGGGSVIDATKFIAAAVPFEGNPWDILKSADPSTMEYSLPSALPFGVVLTLPATGSEMNAFSVISYSEQKEKRGFYSDKVYPKFSILDPEVTYSLSKKQLANGIVDAFTHVLEQYLTYSVDAKIQDRFAEGILLTLIDEAADVLKDNTSYDARANFMWSATMALNGLIGLGVPQDWTTHKIGHVLTARYGLAHAETLAILLPKVLTYKKNAKSHKLKQYAARVWNLLGDESAELAIQKTIDFFELVGVRTKFSDYGINKPDITFIVSQLKKQNIFNLGEHEDINENDVEAILSIDVINE